jgi:hypothetical protein
MNKVLFALLAATLVMVTGCDKTVPVTVTNGLGDWDISSVYIYPADQVSRGADLLATDLVPDSSSVFRMLPGNYNILILDEDTDSYFYGNVTVPAEGYTLEVKLEDLDSGNINAGTGDYPLTITNNLTDYDLWYVYADSAGDELVTEYMGANILFPEETMTLWLAPGTYQVQIVDDSDATFTYEEVVVAETGAAITVKEEDIDAPRAAGATITVVNALESWTITGLLIDGSTEAWGANGERLTAPLTPGQSIDVVVEPGSWDMQATDEDGDTYTQMQQEVGPEGYVWTVTLDQID